MSRTSSADIQSATEFISPLARWPVPANWRWVSANQIARVVGGGTPPSRDEANFCSPGAGIPWITPADLTGYSSPNIKHGRRNLTKEGLANCGAKVVPAGSVLLSSRAPIGYCAIASNPVATSQGFKSLVFTDDIAPVFIRSYLKHSKEYLHTLASGTTFPEISGRKVGEIAIPLPPLPEQRRIVARLEALESRSRQAREKLAAVPAQLAQTRQSLLAAAFRGDLTVEWRGRNQSTETGSALLNRLRSERRINWETSELKRLSARGKTPTDVTWKSRYVEPISSACTDPLPATWTWASLIELEEGDRKSGYGVLKPGPHEPEGIRILKSGQIRHGWVDLSEDYRISPELDEEFAKTRLRGGEILINLVGASIGRSAVAPAETAGCNLSRAIGMIPVPKRIAMYVQLVLGSPVCQNLIAQKTGGSAQGVLNMEEVRSLAIPLPPETEQHEIVRRLIAAFAKLDAAATAHAAAVGTLDRLDQSLLARAFSGGLSKRSRKTPLPRSRRSTLALHSR